MSYFTLYEQYDLILICVLIFDLFHVGHVRVFKYIKERWPGCNVVAGVISDKEAQGYKRLPIINEKNRCEMVSSNCYIDRVIFPAPLIITSTFVNFISPP